MENQQFLKSLLESPGVSSFEGLPAQVWREEAERRGGKVSTDAYGNSFARFGDAAGPRVLLAGHIDEIGLLVTYVDEGGLLFFTGVGISDGRDLVGQRVRVVTEEVQVLGVIGKKPAHLVSADEKGKAIKLEDLWIDIGATDREEALSRVQPGCFAVFEAPVVSLGEHRWASKALDNRVGAFVALEAAYRAAKSGAAVDLVASATTQEEIAGVGANVAAYSVEPDLAIAIDLTHASDVPNVDKKKQGDIRLGGGPVLELGATVHRGSALQLRACAERAGIALQIGISGVRTVTDADHLAKARSGSPTILVSVPNRYMHSTCEVVDLRDVEATIDLLEKFLCELPNAPRPWDGGFS